MTSRADDTPPPEAVIERAIAEHLDTTPAHWILVVSDLDGRVSRLHAPGMPTWQCAGLLAWAAQGDAPQPLWTLDEDEDEDY